MASASTTATTRLKKSATETTIQTIILEFRLRKILNFCQALQLSLDAEKIFGEHDTSATTPRYISVIYTAKHSSVSACLSSSTTALTAGITRRAICLLEQIKKI